MMLRPPRSPLHPGPVSTARVERFRSVWAVRRSVRLSLPRLTPYRVVLSGLLLLTLAFYIWTAATSVPMTFTANSPANRDPYNLLTSAFLRGHAYLPLTVPAGLRHLHDPYNPVANGRYAAAFHDLVYFKGRFYLEWGPTPVLTLFAPFRLTGFRMPQSLAVALYGFVGFVCTVLLLHALARRFVPEAPRWTLLLATGGLALSNVVPFLLRRPVQYEVAISSGYCFEMAGLWLMLTSIMGPAVRRWRLALGSLCLGLAVGGRPDLAVGAAVAVVVALWLLHRRREPRQILIYALGPLMLCAVLLGLYNDLRFGGFSNFGDRYQLAGIDQMHAPFDKVRWILPGLLSYLYVPVRLSLTFPHAFLQTAAADPFITLPHTYQGSASSPSAEPAAGLFTTVPVTLFIFALPALWWRHRRAVRGGLLAATGLALLGLAVAGLLSYSVFGTTERYEVDFVTPLLVAGLVSWLLLWQRLRRVAALRRLVAALGAVLILFGAAVGAAISITGYYDLLHSQHPSTFYSLEDATGPFVTLATLLVGKPEITRVESGSVPVGGPPTGYGAFSQDGASAWLGTTPTTVTIVSPSSGTIGLFASVSSGTGAPAPTSQVIVVHNGNRHPSAALILGQFVRVPISVHTGLNRVRLTLGHATLMEELLLSNLQVGGG
jgi:hypothetical protein